MERNAPLVLECYEKIEMVRAAICTGHTPNVNTVVRKLCSSTDRSVLQGVFHHLHSRGLTLQQSMIQYATACVQPGLDYFNKMFDSSLNDTL